MIVSSVDRSSFLLLNDATGGVFAQMCQLNSQVKSTELVVSGIGLFTAGALVGSALGFKANRTHTAMALGAAGLLFAGAVGLASESIR